MPLEECRYITLQSVLENDMSYRQKRISVKWEVIGPLFSRVSHK